jgi:hypothetical protein
MTDKILYIQYTVCYNNNIRYSYYGVSLKMKIIIVTMKMLEINNNETFLLHFLSTSSVSICSISSLA